MKLSLQVLVGKDAGKMLAIAGPQFLIGRDAACQLRPASPIISNRHCALLSVDGKAYVVDYNSTNGTFINDERVIGHRELVGGDHLRIGPLSFVVHLVVEPPLRASDKSSSEEEFGAILLATGAEPSSVAGINVAPLLVEPSNSEKMAVDLQSIPAKETKVQNPVPKKPVKELPADTATAAQAILAKYSQRNRK